MIPVATAVDQDDGLVETGEKLSGLSLPAS
jgi:hypothetical protein